MNDKTSTIIDNRTGQKFSIKLPKGLIGISFSAGLDSTALFYVVCDYITTFNLESEITILPIHTWESLEINSFDRCEFIICKIKERYPKVNILETEVNFSNKIYSNWAEIQRKFFIDLFLDYGDLKLILQGKQLPPPASELEKWPKGWWNMDKNFLKHPEEYIIKDNPKLFLYRPFYNVDKRMTKCIFRYLKIPDEVYKAIKSCDVDEGLYQRDYFKRDGYFQSKPCKKCLCCIHKRWAFGEY